MQLALTSIAGADAGAGAYTSAGAMGIAGATPAAIEIRAPCLHFSHFPAIHPRTPSSCISRLRVQRSLLMEQVATNDIADVAPGRHIPIQVSLAIVAVQTTYVNLANKNLPRKALI